MSKITSKETGVTMLGASILLICVLLIPIFSANWLCVIFFNFLCNAIFNPILIYFSECLLFIYYLLQRILSNFLLNLNNMYVCIFKFSQCNYNFNYCIFIIQVSHRYTKRVIS